tara:strand:+ start:1202 stop:2794 length:1593 start_codon:yes stop_codon:yes gene_type:complete
MRAVRKRDREDPKTAPKATMRCAVYTRKSSDEGLDQEFNSLDAQRDAAEAFIMSQRAEGWACLPDRYDDGGFSGGSMDRPALDHLLRDIEAGRIDCVVVYKVDRLSRSLMDFARIMQLFEQHGVSFVSVTQQFNTTSSMGRLTLNILLSFAQFEREIIGERIRDKIAAQKRKGKWAGGVPVLGYDVDRSGPSPRLVVNAAEAARVVAMFELYAEIQALHPVVRELKRRKWCNKRRVTKKDRVIGGTPFNASTLYTHLTNPVYIGKIVHKAEVYNGEHEAIVPRELFDRVNEILKYNGRTGGAEVRNKYGALLRGLLRCKACGYAMSHTFARGQGRRTYHRYYRCIEAIKSGAVHCPSKTLPALEIERVVVEEVRRLAEDRDLLKRVLVDAERLVAGELGELRKERSSLTRDLERHHAELGRLAQSGFASADIALRVADLNERIAQGETRIQELNARSVELERQVIDPDEAAEVFAGFDAVWSNLIPREQARLLKLLIEVVHYDAANSSIEVTFRPSSIRAFMDRVKTEAA